jgi:hypothetical protein
VSAGSGSGRPRPAFGGAIIAPDQGGTPPRQPAQALVEMVAAGAKRAELEALLNVEGDVAHHPGAKALALLARMRRDGLDVAPFAPAARRRAARVGRPTRGRGPQRCSYLARTTEPATLSAQVWRRGSHSGHR